MVDTNIPLPHLRIARISPAKGVPAAGAGDVGKPSTLSMVATGSPRVSTYRSLGMQAMNGGDDVHTNDSTGRRG